MLKMLLIGFTLAAGLGSSASARAQAQVTLTINNFQISEAIDLAPGDGMTPWMTFDPLPTGYGLQPFVGVGTLKGNVYQPQYRTGTWIDPIVVDLTGDPYVGARGSMTGRIFPQSHEVFMEAYASPQLSTSNLGEGSFNTGAFTFHIEANTRVVISIDAHTVGSVNPDPFYGEKLETGVWLKGVTGPSEDLYQAIYKIAPADGTDHETDSRYTLTITLDNTADHWARGYVEFGGWIHALSPIPEADRLPAYACGLGIIAWWVRRHKASRSAISTGLSRWISSGIST